MSDHREGTEPSVEDHAGQRRITLRRPQSHNALRSVDQEVLLDAVRDAADDQGVEVVIVAGEGPSFCSGVDLRNSGLPPTRLRHRAVDLGVGDVVGLLLLHEVLLAVANCPKPVVTLLHGHVLAGGYDLALAADIRLATENASIGDPRLLRAMPAAEGWSYLFPLQLGLGSLAPVAYLGRTLTGVAAASLGLVHAVVPSREGLDDLAERMVTTMREVGLDRIRMMKSRSRGPRLRPLREFLDAGIP